ncbi:MAG: cyclase family protein [Chloroflexota bacterium]
MQVIDLTLPFGDGKAGVTFEPSLNIAEHGFNTTTLNIYSHALTHMDAPKHFIEGGSGIESIPLERCIGTAHVLDLTHKTPDSLMTVADLEPYADVIKAGARVLLRTDWSTHADADDYRTRFPRISPALAKWLAECGVWLLGVETPSVASLAPENRAELTEVHQTLLGSDVIIVEGLRNLHLLPPQVEFTALPLHLPGCDGSPVRAVARIPVNKG